MRTAVPIREKHDGALGDRSSVRVWLRLLSCTMAIEKEVQRRFADRSNVRVWLRLLSCTMAIEKELQRRFSERGMTLPRFDVLAALDRHGEMNMGALSQAARHITASTVTNPSWCSWTRLL